MTNSKLNHYSSSIGYVHQKKNAREKGSKANNCHNKRELVSLTTIVIFTHNRDSFDNLSAMRI